MDCQRNCEKSDKTGGRAKAVWGAKRLLPLLALVTVSLGAGSPARADGRHRGAAPVGRSGGAPGGRAPAKMDAEVARRAAGSARDARADVIVTLEDGAELPAAFQRYAHHGALQVIHGYVLDQVPVGQLTALAEQAGIHRVHFNRPTRPHDALSSVAVNAAAVDPTHDINTSDLYPYTGAGVTVAVIDSGFTSEAHPDLAASRVLAFVDFVHDRPAAYDDHGHGTLVTGIIGGTGKLSAKKYAGVAPGAAFVSLKVLNQAGAGTVGQILRALDWVYTRGAAYGVRVVNLSVGAAVTESYQTDPLTQAAKTLVAHGITVVAAAGNQGQTAQGQPQWGGIVAPGNAPWVLTVGAFSTQGSYPVADDQRAAFSSAGPTAVDFAAKPDLCAPGVGVVSTAAPGSALFQAGLAASPSWLLPATVSTRYPYLPYASLSGTSAATPMVSGAIALMLQANPRLTPNLIKGILEYTAHVGPGESPLRQGAGFLNVAHAVTLAALAAHPSAKPVAIPPTWARHLLWGNHRVHGGVLTPTASAWRLGVEWGAAATSDGDHIVWGTLSDGDNIVWGTGSDGDNIVWGTASDGDNIVWGTASDGDNIVWGTDCGGADCAHVVWGTADGDNIVWGTASDGDNIVWGTASDGDNIVWGTGDGDNIVWGTASDGDNIVWGTTSHIGSGTGSDGDNIVWGTATVLPTLWPLFREGR